MSYVQFNRYLKVVQVILHYACTFIREIQSHLRCLKHPNSVQIQLCMANNSMNTNEIIKLKKYQYFFILRKQIIHVVVGTQIDRRTEFSGIDVIDCVDNFVYYSIKTVFTLLFYTFNRNQTAKCIQKIVNLLLVYNTSLFIHQFIKT